MLDQGRFYLGHLGPIPVYVHWTIIVLIYIIYQWATPGNASLVSFVLLLMAFLLGIMLHELGHALAARARGASDITITLWALGGLCSHRGEPNPRGQIFVLAAGPLVSLGLWWGAKIALIALASLPAGSVPQAVPLDLIVLFLAYSVLVNKVLFIFNTLPIYPLDGGQIVYNIGLLATRRHDVVRKFTLACAIAGAALYLGWQQYEFGTIGFFSIIMMAWLVYNAYTSLR
jgi:Zn-dependent protease